MNNPGLASPVQAYRRLLADRPGRRTRGKVRYIGLCEPNGLHQDQPRKGRTWQQPDGASNGDWVGHDRQARLRPPAGRIGMQYTAGRIALECATLACEGVPTLKTRKDAFHPLAAPSEPPRRFWDYQR